MRLLPAGLTLALMTTALAAKNGVIKGMVLEYGSGLPLARSRVMLDVVDAAGVRRVASLLTSRGGQFTFPDLPEGRYLVSASRAAYATAYSGQRRPEGFGQPIQVTADSSPFVELRLHKLGVITGAVKDENGVGMPGMGVSAYPAKRPLRAVKSATTDDRGVYRLFGLAPGPYWIRTHGGETEDGTMWVPTFAPENPNPGDARRFDARIDLETMYADVRATPGPMGTLSGTIVCPGGVGVAVVTLASDTVRQQTTTGCPGSFQFANLPPNRYEVTAVAGNGAWGAFADVSVYGRTRMNNLSLFEIFPTRFEARPLNTPGRLTLRRRDPFGPGEPVEVALGASMKLAPGYWEVAGRLDEGKWLSAVDVAGMRMVPPDADPDWYTVRVEPRPGVMVATVSDGAGVISGTVTHESNPAAAKPVFLLPVTEAARRAIGGAKQTLTDGQGRFRFAGLAPGDYRVLSSDDMTSADDALMLSPAAKAVTLTQGSAQTLSLPLHRVP